MATTTKPRTDLTPFGFTPTESAAYFALLSRGPSTGYAVAREISIARANAYQALRGLVGKGAASVTAENPPKFRAVRPDTLYAQIVDTQSRKLDQLEADLARAPNPGTESVVRITGRRSVIEVMSRTAARESGPVSILAPLSILTALVPVLRKRTADASPTTVFVLGAGGSLPVPITASVSPARMREFFPMDVALLTTPTGALIAKIDGAELDALWSGDPAVTGLAQAALQALVAGAGAA